MCYKIDARKHPFTCTGVFRNLINTSARTCAGDVRGPYMHI